MRVPLVAFMINNPSRAIRFVRWDRSGPMKKNAFFRFYHRGTIPSSYPIIPRSVLTIGYLELAIGTLTSHVSGTCVTKILRFLAMKSDFSQMRPSWSGFDYERI